MTETPPSDPRVPLAQRRTELATFRTALALDRSTLAWIRTTLAMTSFGVGIVAFFRTIRERAETPQAIRMHQTAIRFGVALVIIGVVATTLVAISHLISLRKLRRGETLSTARWPLSITISFLLALLALFGLWSAFTH
jgi:putative membrane protein